MNTHTGTWSSGGCSGVIWDLQDCRRYVYTYICICMYIYISKLVYVNINMFATSYWQYAIVSYVHKDCERLPHLEQQLCMFHRVLFRSSWRVCSIMCSHHACVTAAHQCIHTHMCLCVTLLIGRCRDNAVDSRRQDCGMSRGFWDS